MSQAWNGAKESSPERRTYTVEDRKVNAQKFETAFYANSDLRGIRPPEEPKTAEPASIDLAGLVAQLQKSPELVSALAALTTNQTADASEKSRKSN